MASLQQINVQFDPQEDRLLLSVRADDDSEIRAWLTRRYCRLLLGILGKLAREDQAAADSDEARRAIEAFERDAALANADFSTSYDSSATSHPLGEEPVLVTKIEYQPAENQMIILSLGLPDGRNINLNLSRDLLFALIKLIGDGSMKAEWGLTSAGDGDSGMAKVTPTGAAIH
ncbi:MAG: hypothetical protein ABW074_11360 [Sedimenticola sp.]